MSIKTGVSKLALEKEKVCNFVLLDSEGMLSSIHIV
jgi:hypothetical protein